MTSSTYLSNLSLVPLKALCIPKITTMPFILLLLTLRYPEAQLFGIFDKKDGLLRGSNYTIHSSGYKKHFKCTWYPYFVRVGDQVVEEIGAILNASSMVVRKPFIEYLKAKNCIFLNLSFFNQKVFNKEMIATTG